MYSAKFGRVTKKDDRSPRFVSHPSFVVHTSGFKFHLAQTSALMSYKLIAHTFSSYLYSWAKRFQSQRTRAVASRIYISVVFLEPLALKGSVLRALLYCLSCNTVYKTVKNLALHLVSLQAPAENYRSLGHPSMLYCLSQQPWKRHQQQPFVIADKPLLSR